MPFRVADQPVTPVRLLRRPEDLRTAAPAWDGLGSRSPLVGGSAWVRAWLEVYGSGYELVVLEAGEAGATGAGLPLVRRRGRPWSLEMLGVRELAEPTDVRVADPAALRGVVQTLASMRTPLTLRRLPA